MEDNFIRGIIDTETPVQGELVTTLTEDEAKQLTNDIKATTNALYVLLKRAHDTRAWSALGYKSWTQYIETEFDFSRARSYQLINQAQVIEEINEAAGIDIYLTEKEARDIKKRLPEITEKINDLKNADIEEEEKIEEVKKRIADHYDEKENGNDTFDDEASDVDRASNFTKENSNGFEKDDNDEYGGNSVTKAKLTQEEEFLYEKILVTFKIFDTVPDPKSIASIINLVHEEKAEVLAHAKRTSEWVQQLLKEIS